MALDWRLTVKGRRHGVTVYSACRRGVMGLLLGLCDVSGNDGWWFVIPPNSLYLSCRSPVQIGVRRFRLMRFRPLLDFDRSSGFF